MENLIEELNFNEVFEFRVLPKFKDMKGEWVTKAKAQQERQKFYSVYLKAAKIKTGGLPVLSVPRYYEKLSIPELQKEVVAFVKKVMASEADSFKRLDGVNGYGKASPKEAKNYLNTQQKLKSLGSFKTA